MFCCHLGDSNQFLLEMKKNVDRTRSLSLGKGCTPMKVEWWEQVAQLVKVYFRDHWSHHWDWLPKLTGRQFWWSSGKRAFGIATTCFCSCMFFNISLPGQLAQINFTGGDGHSFKQCGLWALPWCKRLLAPHLLHSPCLSLFSFMTQGSNLNFLENGLLPSLKFVGKW